MTAGRKSWWRRMFFLRVDDQGVHDSCREDECAVHRAADALPLITHDDDLDTAGERVRRIEHVLRTYETGDRIRLNELESRLLRRRHGDA